MSAQSVIVVSDQIDMSALQSHHSDHCFQRMRLMTAYGTAFFSMNDVNRLMILQDVIDGRLTTRLPATRLEISDRHRRRLLERYHEHGPLSLVNRRSSQPGNRQIMPCLAERALRIIRERYADFGPTLASEKLADVHGL